MVWGPHQTSAWRCVKNFQCDVCERSFPTSQNLKNHIKEVHKKSRDLKCSKCDKSYKQSQTILRHIRNFHEGRCLLVILCCHTKDMLEISAHEGIRIDSNMCGWKQVHIIKTSKTSQTWTWSLRFSFVTYTLSHVSHLNFCFFSWTASEWSNLSN